MILPLALMLQATSAVAVEAPAAQPALTLADVVVRPRRGSFDSYYPEEAQRLEISGEATARCRIAVGGLLRDCVVLSVMPGRQAFEMATARILQNAQADSATRGGEPSAGRNVKVTVRFESYGSNFRIKLE
jgi:TonB family protein